MKAIELMTKKVITCYEKDKISKLIEVMKVNDIGFVPIINETEEIKGVVTDRDIVLSIDNDFTLKKECRDIMTKNTIYISQNTEIDEVLNVMKLSKIKRIMLVNRNNKLTGILSLNDIAKTYLAGENYIDIIKDISTDSEFIPADEDLRVDDFVL